MNRRLVFRARSAWRLVTNLSASPRSPPGSGFAPGDLVVGDSAPAGSLALHQLRDRRMDMCRNGNYTEWA